MAGLPRNTDNLKMYLTDGIKGVPLNALPEEAWAFITGDGVDVADLKVVMRKVPWLGRGVKLLGQGVAMTSARKVLIVDDDPIVRKSFDRVLSGKGYAVIAAENGEEALRKLNEEKYDVVYTDIRMPGMSGLEVAEQVKARRPWTPVVIITGYGTEAAQARAKAAGVSSFLNKPLTPEMIEGSARDALAAPVAAAEAVAEAAVLPATAEASVARSVGLALKNIVLFLAAPFIGLAYVIALPFVGLGLLAVLAGKAVLARIKD